MLPLAFAGVVGTQVPRTDSLSDSVAAVATALTQQGGAAKHVNAVAQAVHKYATQRQLPLALVVGIIGIENKELNPHSRSSVGATGIMQVMPHWKADIRDCGHDLTAIDTNICFGTKILEQNLARAKSVRGALLRYLGCATPAKACTRYVNAVLARVRAAEAVLSQSLTVASTEDTP